MSIYFIDFCFIKLLPPVLSYKTLFLRFHYHRVFDFHLYNKIVSKFIFGVKIDFYNNMFRFTLQYFYPKSYLDYKHNSK